MSTTLITPVGGHSYKHSPPEILCFSVFMSPLPNPKLWTNSTIGFLQTQDCFTDGGWWHDQNILGATGQGVEKEEPRAWDGWWNDQIVVIDNRKTSSI